MTRTHQLVFLLALIPIFSFAQNILASGQVQDSASKAPIEFCTVSLIDWEGKIATQVVTDKNGKFSIGTKDTGTYTVSFIYVGCYKKSIPNLSITKKTALGIITLQPFATRLQEVVVKGQANAMQLKPDRQVFKASQFGNATSGTAVDVLRNLPSVAVNALGGITLRGSDNFLVLINGKPTQADANLVLSQLAAGSIENVEVITSPSAKYDPDGKAGIINITTKKGTDDGWLLLANAMGGAPSFHDYNNSRRPSRYSGDITIGYKKNKWDLNSGANYLRNDASGSREGYAYTYINGTKTLFPSTGERSFKRYNYAARLSASFAADANNNLSAGFYIGQKHQDREADLNYSNSKQDSATGKTISQSKYYNANNQAREGQFTLGNIDYTHRFKDKSSIAVSLLYEGADLHGGTTNNNLTNATSKDTIQFTHNLYNNPLKGYREKIDYQRKWGAGTLEAGYQYRYDTQDGSFDYYTKVLGTGNYVLDPAFSSAVKVKNEIHSAYTQYSVQAKKWYYSGGLRYESADRELYFADVQQPSLLLHNFFPSAQLRYTTSAQWRWKADYSRRVKRTTNFELNPFPEREHSETMEQGDAKLLPEFVTLIEAGSEKTWGKGSWYATGYYQSTKNIIQRLN
ncbi:TonB-dependent receptor, partial [Parasediminibacterium sp. JCM 36343]|uniref:TonB-dependent receptor n=1 Tax=Parasediminibacterium sp. JCM 36343 TaxID=3374279 RepID=UPI0039783F3F